MKYLIQLISITIALFSFSGLAYSETYYWIGIRSGVGYNMEFPSATAACDYFHSRYATSTSIIDKTRNDVLVSPDLMRCSFLYYPSTRQDFQRNLCPANSDKVACTPPEPNGEVCGPKDVTGYPKIKNASGECVTLLLADKPSTCKYFKNNVRQVATQVQFDSNGVPSGPPSIESVGCVVLPVGPSPYANCKQSAPRKACSNGICIEMQSTVAKCTVTAQFTGEVADGQPGFTGDSGGGEGPCDPDKDCTPDTPPTVTDRQPCTYVTDAEGRQSCSSFDYKGVPGESSQCGEVNGQMTCISKQPPTSNGTQIDTKVETKPNQDGTTTTTKTDVRTDVHCTGAGSCQSVTTKTTNVTIKDSNGNTLSSDTKCEGSKCSQGSGKGDGTGTGTGDCIVDCESQSGEVTGPELGEVSGFGESLTDFMSGVEQTPLMSAISGIGLTGSGSCSFPSATTMIGTISFDSICTNSGWLDPLYYVFLAVWAFLAVRVLMSA